MEYQQRTKLTEKQRSARKKGRKTKANKNKRIARLESIIKLKDKQIFELNEKIKLLEGELLLK